MPLNREAIIARRKALVLTQEDCAARMGYAKQRWCEIETGKRTDLKLSEVEAVACALECSVLDILVNACNKPLPAVMLAKKFDAAEHEVTNWFISEKYDGVRARWDGRHLVTRSNHIINAPSWFTAGMPNVELDGELWMGRGTIEDVAGCVSCEFPDDRWHSVRFVVFDAPQGVTYAERLAVLRSLALPAHVEIADQSICRSPSHLVERMTAIVEQGGEGLIVRDPHAFYVRGRSNQMLKVKPLDDAEATVDGVNSGSAEVTTDDGVKLSLPTSTLKTSPRIGDRITFTFSGRTKRRIPRCPVAVRIRTEE